MHLLNVRVSEFPLVPMFSISNFIASSRFLPHFRASIRTSLTINKLHSLSVSSSPAPVSLCENASNEHSFKVSYLVNTFGWPLELANSKAKYLKFKTLEKPEEVLAFFKKHGFTKTQISSMVRRFPRLLACNPEITLFPKLAFLSSLGLSRTEITNVVAAAPLILTRSFEKVVITSFNFLSSLVHSHDKAVEVIKRHPMVLTRVPEREHIQILREVGVPKANIVISMCRQSRGFSPTADSYRKLVVEVMELGFDPSSMKFLWAIRTLTSMSKSTWEHKVQVFKKYGWSDREILMAFEKDQNFITASEDKIVRIMDFLVNRMGVEATTVANWPKIFSLSLERRIVPRCLVYQVLLEKVLCKRKRKPSLFSVVLYSENQFLSVVIKRYENDVPELLDLYEEMLDIRK